MSPVLDSRAGSALRTPMAVGSRRGVARAALAACLSALPPAAVAAQQNFASVEILTTQLAEGLYMLTGSGGNLGLSVGSDGAFLVDDQFAPLTPKIMAAIRAVTSEPVRFVLNTHWHGDHTGGNENLGRAGALIVAHENVRRRMNPREFRDLIGRSAQAADAALPVITFNDAANFYWNGENIRVFHVASAHTDGDAVVWFTNANVVHMGDLFFNGSYPFIDLDSGGGLHGVLDAAARVLEQARPDTKIIPGHGALAGPAELRAYREMLVTVRDRVQRLMGEGMSEDQVVAARPTQDLDARWGTASERLVRAVVRSLAR